MRYEKTEDGKGSVRPGINCRKRQERGGEMVERPSNLGKVRGLRLPVEQTGCDLSPFADLGGYLGT